MKTLKKALVILAGGALLVAGIAMLVLPGPAFAVIPVALAILAVEFVWARRWLAWMRERLKALVPGKSPGDSARIVEGGIVFGARGPAGRRDQ